MTSEVKIMAAVTKLFDAAEYWEYRSEAVIVLNGESVSLDLIARNVDDVYVAVEGKVKLYQEVISQAIRWRPYFHRIYVAVNEPRHQGHAHKVHRTTLRSAGIGLIYVTDQGIAAVQFKSGWNTQPDTTKPNAAFITPQAANPPAGSPTNAEGRRITPKRGKWWPMVEYIQANGGGYGVSWKEINRDVEFTFRATCHQACKAIKDHQLPITAMVAGGLTIFFNKPEAEI